MSHVFLDTTHKESVLATSHTQLSSISRLPQITSRTPWTRPTQATSSSPGTPCPSEAANTIMRCPCFNPFKEKCFETLIKAAQWAPVYQISFAKQRFDVLNVNQLEAQRFNSSWNVPRLFFKKKKKWRNASLVWGLGPFACCKVLKKNHFYLPQNLNYVSYDNPFWTLLSSSTSPIFWHQLKQTIALSH